MTELATLARPYAKAAFEYACAGKVLQEWSSSLAMVAAVVQQVAVGELLHSPTMPATKKATILFEICDREEELSQQVKHFIFVMAENKRLLLLHEVHRLFESFKAQREKFSEITVRSAFKISAPVEKELTGRLNQALACDVSLSTIIDKSLIGGVVINAGDMVIDGSVRGRLNKLTEMVAL